METNIAEIGQTVGGRKQRPMRAPIYVPLAAFALIGTALFSALAAALGAFSVMVMQLGRSALSVSALLSRQMLSEMWQIFLELFTDYTIAVVIVAMMIVGLIHHWVAGRIERRWLVWLATTGFGWLLMAVLILILAAFNQQDPNFRAMSVLTYLVMAAFFGFIGAFITAICASVALLIERRYRRKARARMVKDVF